MRPGQALVIILLILAVGLTVGLSIVSRSVTDVGISTISEESARALAAAEAGVESALAGNVTVGNKVQLVTGADEYEVESITDAGGGPTVYFDEGYVAGDAATLFLVSHNPDGTLKENSSGSEKYTGQHLVVCWGAASAPSSALEAVLYYKTGASYRVSRNIYDPSVGRTQGSVLPDTGLGGCPTDRSYQYKKIITFANSLANGGFGVNLSTDNLLFVRFRPYYNGDTPLLIGVTSGATP